MYIACLCSNLVSVYFYAIPILHFKFPNFLFTCLIRLWNFYNELPLDFGDVVARARRACYKSYIERLEL